MAAVAVAVVVSSGGASGSVAGSPTPVPGSCSDPVSVALHALKNDASETNETAAMVWGMARMARLLFRHRVERASEDAFIYRPRSATGIDMGRGCLSRAGLAAPLTGGGWNVDSPTPVARMREPPYQGQGPWRIFD